MKERIKFNVEMELTKDQALAMQAFFKRWNHLSVMGSSRFDTKDKPDVQTTTIGLEIPDEEE